eukprot:1733539-Rhodomonas_salina.1
MVRVPRLRGGALHVVVAPPALDQTDREREQACCEVEQRLVRLRQPRDHAVLVADDEEIPHGDGKVLEGAHVRAELVGEEEHRPVDLPERNSGHAPELHQHPAAGFVEVEGQRAEEHDDDEDREAAGPEEHILLGAVHPFERVVALAVGGIQAAADGLDEEREAGEDSDEEEGGNREHGVVLQVCATAQVEDQHVVDAQPVEEVEVDAPQEELPRDEEAQPDHDPAELPVVRRVNVLVADDDRERVERERDGDPEEEAREEEVWLEELQLVDGRVVAEDCERFGLGQLRFLERFHPAITLLHRLHQLRIYPRKVKDCGCAGLALRWPLLVDFGKRMSVQDWLQYGHAV